MLTRYYSLLFTLANPTQLDPVLNVVEPRVSAEMNAELLKPFVEAEVQLALKQMDANTAPGPDGLSPLFTSSFGEKLVGRSQKRFYQSLI